MKQAEFLECGSTEGDKFFKVIKSFYLIVRAGPPEALPVGATVRMRPDSARDNFFAGRVIPTNLSDPGRYEVTEKFQTVNAGGYWESLNVGDVLELSMEEALPLLRKFQIKRIEGGEEK